MQAIRSYSHSSVPIFFFPIEPTQPETGDQPPVEKALGFPPIGGFIVEYRGSDYSLFGLSVEKLKEQDLLFAVNVSIEEPTENLISSFVKRDPEPIYIVGQGISRDEQESNIFGAAIEMDSNWEATGIISLYVVSYKESENIMGVGVYEESVY